MFLAKVKGHVVSTQKDPALAGSRLVIVEPLRVDYAQEVDDKGQNKGGGKLENTGRAIVAVDRLGVAEGQLVLIVQGSSARLAEGASKLPIDALVLGLVDHAQVGDKELIQ